MSERERERENGVRPLRGNGMNERGYTSERGAMSERRTGGETERTGKRDNEGEREREDERDKVQRVGDRDHLATSESKRQ